MSTRARLVGHTQLFAEVQRRLSASSLGEEGLRIGLEVELIPARADGGARLPMHAPPQGGASSMGLVRAAASRHGWQERRGPDGLPVFDLPGPGSLTFEPGGQIEVRTATAASVGAAAESALEPLRLLWDAAEETGVELLTRGMDPRNGVGDLQLGVASSRYHRQAAHYAGIGPWGHRMMLQSAALHVNLDLGGRPVRRWIAANRMAPYLTAIFANSSRYQGEDTGFRSFRAEQWRHLDPSRTGVFADDRDAAREYLAFALEARDFMAARDGEEAVSFRKGWEAGADLDAWRAHLTTLFPEVRPRGYLEVRSIDALRPAWLPVPAILLAGILYDPASLEQALRLLPEADPERLGRAGRVGLADEELAGTSIQLVELALEGARRLSGGHDGEVLEIARAFHDRFTRVGRDPGHEDGIRDPFEP